MKFWQRIVCYFIMSIVCILLFLGCSEQILINTSPIDNVNLSKWLGDYSFYEFYPPNITMEYNINIYKEDDEYCANINIDGFQSTKRIKAKVLSNQDGIDLAFETYLPNSDEVDINKGDVLLSFKMGDSAIYTIWRKIEPILPENKISGKVYYEKVK